MLVGGLATDRDRISATVERGRAPAPGRAPAQLQIRALLQMCRRAPKVARFPSMRACRRTRAQTRGRAAAQTRGRAAAQTRGRAAAQTRGRAAAQTRGQMLMSDEYFSVANSLLAKHRFRVTIGRIA